ncbi:hypothetical protein LTR17_005477 [Elasticomyces elasticus]|nr:hypothetical protein LTR17_005477 [Elasticomyces elasticus]
MALQMSHSLEAARKRFTDMQQHAEAEKGKPRTAKDSETLIKHFGDEVEHWKKEGRHSQPEGSVLTTVGMPYTPCIKSLYELKKITLSELRTETHHRGKMLIVQRKSKLLFARAMVCAVVVDETGDAEVLQLVHADIALGEDGLLRTDGLLVIKEPYFTFNTEKTGIILVDHPSDIVSIPISHAVAPAEFLLQHDGGLIEIKSATEWKTAGNKALGAKRYAKAINCYSQGLAAATPAVLDVRFDLYRNRAQANLCLERFDAALSDALAAIIGSEEARARDSKAYFRAAYAGYHLRAFVDAKKHLERMLELTPDDSDGARLLERINVRLHEQATGEYDFPAITRNISTANKRVDVADFFNKTELKTSTGRGRGLFATVDIKPGEIVVCEKAFCAVFDTDEHFIRAATYGARNQTITPYPYVLWKAAITKLHRSPSTLTKITTLTGEWPGLGGARVVIDGTTIIDTFEIHDIVGRNGYASCTPSKQQADTIFGYCGYSNETNGSGIWSYASYLNHSCVPSVERCPVGDLMIYRAVKPIARGEEIFACYDFLDGVENRHEEQERVWGFLCDCTLCVAEILESSETKEKRRKLAEAAKAFVDDHSVVPNSDQATVTRAEMLIKRIKSTYHDKKYEGVPRTAALELQYWLTRAYSHRKDSKRCLASTAEMFRLLAWKSVKLDANNVILEPGKGSRLSVEAVMSLNWARNCMVIDGKAGLALKLSNKQKELYIMLNGVANGFPEIPVHLVAQGG